MDYWEGCSAKIMGGIYAIVTAIVLIAGVIVSKPIISIVGLLYTSIGTGIISSVLLVMSSSLKRKQFIRALEVWNQMKEQMRGKDRTPLRIGF